MTQKPTAPNDDRADVKNPNNPKRDADLANREKLGHPNVAAPPPKPATEGGKG